MPFVTVGKENSANLDLYYKDRGSGRAAIFSHGWPLSSITASRMTGAVTSKEQLNQDLLVFIKS